MDSQVFTLEQLTDNVASLHLDWHVKRLDGAFVLRLCWQYVSQSKRHECAWEGFVTVADAVQDLLAYYNAQPGPKTVPPEKSSSLLPDGDYMSFT